MIIMDSLTCGGAEKSLISLLPFLAERNYDLTLMLRARGGLFEQYVPENVKIADFPYNASKIGRLLYSVSLRMPWNKHMHTAEIYWRSIGKHFPALGDEYDVAIAYTSIINYLTWFVDFHVDANEYIGWIHFDASKIKPDRKMLLYLHKKMKKIYVVSQSALDAFTAMFPELTEKSELRYNVVDKKQILALETFVYIMSQL